MKKIIWKSKTFWVNVIVIAGALLTDVGGILSTEGTISIIAIVNIILRLVTKSEVTFK